MRPLRARQALSNGACISQDNSGRTHHALYFCARRRRYVRLDTRSTSRGRSGVRNPAPRPGGRDPMDSRQVSIEAGLCGGSNAHARRLGGGQPLSFSPSHIVMIFMVPAFFALSGFLVTGSALRLRATVPFLTFRFLRILPALFVEVTLSALVLGPLFTRLPLAHYFSDPQFMRYFGNIAGTHHVLPSWRVRERLRLDRQWKSLDIAVGIPLLSDHSGAHDLGPRV